MGLAAFFGITHIMIKTKLNGDYLLKNFPVVKKPVIPDTLLQIPHGKTVRFSCGEIGPMGSVRSAACRLNQRLGREEFTVTPLHNGAMFDVKRA